MKYTENDVDKIHNRGIEQATSALHNIDVVRGRDRNISFKGLNGWVFEQTIRTCLEGEFANQLRNIAIKDQLKLKGNR